MRYVFLFLVFYSCSLQAGQNTSRSTLSMVTIRASLYSHADEQELLASYQSVYRLEDRSSLKLIGLPLKTLSSTHAVFARLYSFDNEKKEATIFYQYNKYYPKKEISTHGIEEISCRTDEGRAGSYTVNVAETKIHDDAQWAVRLKLQVLYQAVGSQSKS